MRAEGSKLDFVARHRLRRVNPTILEYLLRLADPITRAEQSAFAKSIVINSLDSFLSCGEDVEATGWYALVINSISKIVYENNIDYILMSAADLEPLVPQAVTMEIENSIEDAAIELQSLRAMSRVDLNQAYADLCDELLRKTDTPREADWVTWLAKPSWTLEETAALLLGKEPFVLNLTAKKLPNWARSAFSAKLDLLERHVGAGQLKSPVTLAEIQRWTAKHDLAAPSELCGKPMPGNPSRSSDEGEPRPNTLAVLRHALLYFAVTHHGYDPVAALKTGEADIAVKSRVPKQISDALKNAGLQSSDRTIRDHLKAAVEMVVATGGEGALKKLARHRKLPSSEL